MFPRRKLPDELGELVEVHRPHHWLGWLVPTVVSVPFALLFALGPPGPLVGLSILLMLGYPTAFMLAEWFLLQHRVYENGIVFRTEVPGTYCYAVPFATIDPDRVKVAGLHGPPKGEFRLALRQERQNPLVPTTLRFPGLDPKTARDLARGRVSWQEATTVGAVRYPRETWQVSFRDAENRRQWFADTVRRGRAASR